MYWKFTNANGFRYNDNYQGHCAATRQPKKRGSASRRAIDTLKAESDADRDAQARNATATGGNGTMKRGEQAKRLQHEVTELNANLQREARRIEKLQKAGVLLAQSLTRLISPELETWRGDGK